MKYLVTGSAGFIGSALAGKLLNLGHEVVGVDCYLPNLYSEHTKQKRTKELLAFEKYEFIEHDLRDHFPIQLLDDCAAVFNLAAMAGLAPSWNDFDTYVGCNLSATNNLLAALSTKPKIRLIHASTSSVYGDIQNGDESAELQPISPYGVTKLAAENLIQSYARKGGLNYINLRLFSVYGPDQRIDMAYSRIISAIYNQETVQIFGTGAQSRSNTYIDDVVEAFILAEKSLLRNETLNICGDEEISLLQFVEMASEKIKISPEIEFGPVRAGDQRVTKGDNSKAKKLLGWNPKVDFSQGIDLQISAFLKDL
ncbi:NAD-dependent epimerase/dehydratase family protein [Candidatus Planktophila versatilis]|jgi:UDP-glucuronate 4-epimerase|uniref:NAD-dependent epimerase/dehydratase family protein n=1 Tax=Candidatus Planktophila versatilis TaxID=1884905 RepID=UPI003CEC32CD